MTQHRSDNFFSKVYALVEQIPRGKVATYGQIAALISTPRAARQVGYAMRTYLPNRPTTPPDHTIPWQRVINAKGRLSIQNPHVTAREQAERLRQEGIALEERDGSYRVDLEKYLHRF